jgi:hypothetical protein
LAGTRADLGSSPYDLLARVREAQALVTGARSMEETPEGFAEALQPAVDSLRKLVKVLDVPANSVQQ